MWRTDHAAFLFGAVGAVGVAIMLLRAVPGRGDTGVRPGPIHCPKCGEVIPLVRAPSSFRQAAWDGYICKACGQSMDRWGRAKA